MRKMLNKYMLRVENGAKLGSNLRKLECGDE